MLLRKALDAVKENLGDRLRKVPETSLESLWFALRYVVVGLCRVAKSA